MRLELLGLTTRAGYSATTCPRDTTWRSTFRIEDVPRRSAVRHRARSLSGVAGGNVNAAVHLRRREVWVSVRGTATEIRLEVVDRGVGFDRSVPFRAAASVGGDPRASQAVNGDSVIVSRPGEGTRVEAWVPLRPDA
jgi:hypothetical protein